MSRHRAKGKAENSNGWLTTFNDLVTLLMVFFVLLFTMSTTEMGKLKQFQVSIMKGLGVLKAGEGSPVGVIESFGDKGSNVGMVKGKEIIEGQESIEDYMKVLESVRGTEFELRGDNHIVRFDGAALFGSGSHRINPNAYPMLKEICNALNELPGHIRVEGHTDNIPIFTEKFESNWALSTARAVSIVKYFIDKGEVPPERLSAVGYGDSKPLVPNDTPAHRARNRRVEIILENREQTNAEEKTDDSFKQSDRSDRSRGRRFLLH